MERKKVSVLGNLSFEYEESYEGVIITFGIRGIGKDLGIYNYMRCLFYVHRALGVFYLVCVCVGDWDN